MESSKYWERRALARLTNTERNSAIATRRLKAMYNQANKDLKKSIDNIYKNYSKDTGLDIQTLKTLLSKKETDAFWKTLEGQGLKKYVKNNYKSRITRLEQIQAELYAKCKELAPKEELLTREAYAHTIKSTYDRTIYDTAKGTGYDIAFNTVDNRTINALLSERWAGGNYSSRVWTNTDILADTVSTIVGGGLISGMSLSKMTADVQDAVGGGYSRANRLVRTEANRFNNEAEALAYEELGVDKYVFIATLDSRTSPMCQEMDNKIIDFKDKEVGVNYPPLHPYCRSTVRPYIDEEAERHIRRKARDPKTGKVVEIGNVSYRDWLAGKTEPPKAKVIKKLTPATAKGGIVYREATTIAEAEEIAKSCGIQVVSYKGMDIKVANEMNKSLVEAVNYCPKLKDRVNFYGITQERNRMIRPELTRYYYEVYEKRGYSGLRLDDMVSRTVSRTIGRVPSNNWGYAFSGECSPTASQKFKDIWSKYSGIGINEKYAKNVKAFIDGLEYGVKVKYHPVGCDTIRSVLDHELGHQLDYAYDLRKDTDINDLWTKFRKLKLDERKDVLSEYANTNIAEFIAEGYSEYVNNPEPREYAKAIGEIIEKRVKNG